MTWPMETVKLSDCDEAPVDEWVGYLVPGYLAGLPNANAAALYTLEFECGVRWTVAPGPLVDEIWRALLPHGGWCKS
jgi:hypothetical protein